VASYINAVRIRKCAFDIVRLQCVRMVAVGPIGGEMLVFPVILVQSAVIRTYPEIAGIRVFYNATDRIVTDRVFIGRIS